MANVFDEIYGRPKRRRTAMGISQSEQDALTQRIGGAALSGLSKAGNILDLPGSMVRDLVAGENPIDQLLSPTRPDNRTSGRDLLRQFGAIGGKDTYGNFAGGLGAEIALDPLTYLSLGASALTKSGRTARAAGKLSKTRAGRIGAGQAGLVGVGLPFADPLKALGTGKTAQRVAGGLDKAGAAIKATPVGRAARMLFDPRAGNQYSKTGQEAAELAYDLKPAALAEARSNAFDASRRMEEVFSTYKDHFGVAPGEIPAAREAFDKIARLSAESQRPLEAFDLLHGGNAKFMQAGKPVSDDLAKATHDAGKAMQKANEEVHSRIMDLGGKTSWLGSEGFSHFPRSLSKRAKSEFGQTRILPASHGGMLKRSEEIRTVPAEIVNRVLRDPAARGDDAATHIAETYGKWLESPDQAAPLAEWVSRHSKKFEKEGIDLFDKSTLDDFSGYQLAGHNVAASLSAIQDLFGANVVDDGVDLASAFRSVGLDPDAASKEFLKRFGGNATDVKVSPEAVEAAASVIKPIRNPEWGSKIGEWIDNATNAFKTAVTTPFPAFHARNFVSGQYMNLTSNLINSPGDLAQYGKAFDEARRLLKKDSNPDIMREIAANNVVGHHSLDVGISTGAGGLPGNPLDVRGSAAAAAERVDQSTSGLFPRSRRAIGTVTETGSRVAAQTEWLNRVTPYLYLRNKGWSPVEAAKKVHELQVDYSALTQFEKTVMRRLIPFYSFTRRTTPALARRIMEKPGGSLAQTLRASNSARETTGTTPDYVAQSTAVGLGKLPDGSERYLTGFGLAHEDPLSFMGSAQEAGLEFLSRTNPLIKAPLEAATGTSFFQRGPIGGRPLESMDPTLGRTIANVKQLLGGEETRRASPLGSRGLEFAVANSPLSRVSTSARQLSDPRKGLGAKAVNLLTGFNVSDISPAAQDAVLRERAQRAMKALGGRTFSRTSIPEDVIATLPPDQQLEARRFNALIRELANRTKARKETANR